MVEHSCMVELTDEEGQVQEVMTLLSPNVKPEIIHLDHGFVDGIVLLTGIQSGSLSAISFFRSKAVCVWVSQEDGEHSFQN